MMVEQLEHNEQQKPWTEQPMMIFDLDRTLLNTDNFTSIVTEKLESQGISSDDIRRLRQETELTGGSFDTFTVLRGNYSTELVDKIASEVEEEALRRQDLSYDDPRCLFMPGARELLASIPQANYILLTKGGEETQKIKLRGAIGLDLDHDYYAITSRSDKGQLIAESYDFERRTFTFPWIHNKRGDLSAAHVVLVDDKASAFRGLEQLGGCAKGYWLQPFATSILKSQQLSENEPLPCNVERIESLEKVRSASIVERLGETSFKNIS